MRNMRFRSFVLLLKEEIAEKLEPLLKNLKKIVLLFMNKCDAQHAKMI